jgi:hypothetical protein
MFEHSVFLIVKFHMDQYLSDTEYLKYFISVVSFLLIRILEF